MKEGWMKNDKAWMKNDEGWKMNDEGWWFQAVEGFCFRTHERTDICDCRVAFATEKRIIFLDCSKMSLIDKNQTLSKNLYLKYSSRAALLLKNIYLLAWKKSLYHCHNRYIGSYSKINYLS